MSETEVPPSVCYIAIIGPDNNPIYTQKYCSEKQKLEMDTILFCSLDYFDQQVSKKTVMKSNDSFLGCIQTTDRFQIWGYKTGLKYKIIVLTSHIASLSDNFMQSFCDQIKDALFNAIMDPFYTPFSVLDSPRFQERIQALIKTVPSSS